MTEEKQETPTDKKKNKEKSAETDKDKTPDIVYSDGNNSEAAAEFQDDDMEPNEFLEDFLQQEEDGTLYGDPR